MPNSAHMTTLAIRDLNERARDIFRQIVEGYLANGEPIGSRTISKLPDISLSAASIRNVMQDLEELGLLASPHTSAGRIPTELGLRLFVDGIMQVGELASEDRDQIELRCRADGKRMEDVLGEATTLLSGLSSCAGVVVAPKSESAVRQIEFVPLSQTRALGIVVGQDGSVENRLIDLPVGMPASALVRAGNYLNARLAGLTLEQAAASIERELANGKAELDELSKTVVERGLAVLRTDSADRDILIVRGQAKLLDNRQAEEDLERVRKLLEDMESKRELIRALDLARNGQGMKVFIGAENKLFSLSGSSVIAAPYRNTEDRVVGVVGVIGPTRLNYARVIPMVDYTARVLSRLVS
jgi:heat-inducible transcriptional repressor